MIKKFLLEVNNIGYCQDEPCIEKTKYKVYGNNNPDIFIKTCNRHLKKAMNKLKIIEKGEK